jgi:hypothetical protein
VKSKLISYNCDSAFFSSHPLLTYLAHIKFAFSPLICREMKKNNIGIFAYSNQSFNLSNVSNIYSIKKCKQMYKNSLTFRRIGQTQDQILKLHWTQLTPQIRHKATFRRQWCEASANIIELFPKSLGSKAQRPNWANE